MFYFSLFVSLVWLIGSPAVAEDNQPIHESGPFVKGQILVKIDPKYGAEVLSSVERSVGAKKILNFPIVEGLNLYQFDPNIDVNEIVKKFLLNKAVEYAEPNYVYSINHTLQTSTNDPEFGKQWSLENKGQNNGVVDADINAEAMWGYQKGKKGVVIGIIDTGIDYRHPDLVDNLWKNPGEIPGNGKDDDQNGYDDDVYGINAIKKDGNPLDDHLHGTHVAGIIGAKGDNALGISGVAQSVELVSCKFLTSAGFGSISDALTCMDYFASLKSRAQNPVNLVATNNSWGGGAKSQAMFDAIKAHERLGILFVAAAGNQGSDNDVVETFPANYKLKNVISVAATDSSDRLASFSNHGKKTVHVAAPGVKIFSTLINNKYGELSGTSMAAPHVTGLAAIIASHFSDLSYRSIKNLIMTGGQRTTAASTATISGKRIRGADQAGIGSLTCENQSLLVREQPTLLSYRIALGQSLFLSAFSINCALPQGPLTLWQGPDGNVVLEDQGTHGDIEAQDSIYSLDWTPTKEGTYLLKFSDNDVVSVVVYTTNLKN
jgi:subtilisin family serine protease